MDWADVRRKIFREALRGAIRAAAGAGVKAQAIEEDMVEISRYVRGLVRSVEKAKEKEDPATAGGARSSVAGRAG